MVVIPESSMTTVAAFLYLIWYDSHTSVFAVYYSLSKLGDIGTLEQWIQGHRSEKPHAMAGSKFSKSVSIDIDTLIVYF